MEQSQGSVEGNGRVGQRFVSDDGDAGTVVFEGPVKLKSSHDVWLGVRWDKLERGKSDGTAEGVRYYETPGKGETASYSFIKPDRLLFGTSFVEELKERYGTTASHDSSGSATSAGPQDIDKVVVVWDDEKDRTEKEGESEVEAKKLEIELVGMQQVGERLSKLDQLSLADLSDTRVAYWTTENSGGVSAISTAGKSLEDVDLSKTLLANWGDIMTICRHLPALKTLRLSKNRYHNLFDGDADVLSTMPTVNVLTLTDTLMSWSELALLAIKMLPNLADIHFCSNRISDLGLDSTLLGSYGTSLAQCFASLRLLNLENNHIADWNTVNHLAALPNLERLVLNRNKLKQIVYPAVADGDKGKDASGAPFASLLSLSLDDNAFEDWKDILALNEFTALREVRIRQNPLYDSTDLTMSRSIAIARHPHLRILNGSEIFKSEREEAERWYVTKHIGALAISLPEQELREVHPQFFTLLAKHGLTLSTLGKADVAAATIADNLITVHISSLIEPASTKTQKVPKDMQLLAFKLLCQTLFNVPAGTSAVLHHGNKGKPGAQLIGDVSSLDALGLSDGSEVVMQ